MSFFEGERRRLRACEAYESETAQTHDFYDAARLDDVREVFTGGFNVGPHTRRYMHDSGHCGNGPTEWLTRNAEQERSSDFFQQMAETGEFLRDDFASDGFLEGDLQLSKVGELLQTLEHQRSLLLSVNTRNPPIGDCWPGFSQKQKVSVKL